MILTAVHETRMGTLIVFRGTDGKHGYLVAVDQRMARIIEAAIAAGEAPECEVESWQIVGEVRDD